MTYRTEAVAVAARAERTLLQLWNAYSTGTLSADEFVEFGADALAAHNEQAAELAAVALARDLTRLGQDVDPHEVDRSGDVERLQKALRTLVEKIDDGDNGLADAAR